MIHVHGGSALLEKLRAAMVPGEFLEWCDVLCQGPTPAGLAPDAWRATRAAFLRESGPALDGKDAALSLAAQDAALEGALSQDEMVLWFGPELFCQAILLYLLNWLGQRRDALPRRVSLVCVGEYPGVDDRRSCTPAFLSPDQLHDVFARRETVGDEQFDLAREAWTAFTGASPLAVADVAATGTAALRYLAPALRRHLEELPATDTGLNRTERGILEALDARDSDFSELQSLCQEGEERRWLTDVILWDVLRRLAAGRAPLVSLPPDAAPAWPPPRGAPIRITPMGRDVLLGRRDWIAENGIDRWVGGVHLERGNVWRWEREGGHVVPP
jgi:hypothetical protein